MVLEELSPAIIVVAFNRADALARLLGSIERAYYETDNIPLVISIDGEGDKRVIDVANNFSWKHGKKEVVIHDSNLGLKEHVIQCGDLTEKYGSIIMLEEDCFVSKYFYSKGTQLLEFYQGEEKVAGVSLYAYGFNENALLPFIPMKDEYDSYFMQVPSSWGQAWTNKQWGEFKEFLETTPKILESDKLPENVKSWPESSWKKYFYKYLINSEKFIVYPQVSLTVNFGDEGTHYSNQTNIWQVPLEERSSSLKLVSSEGSINKYDAYFEISPKAINLKKDILIDLYGTKQFELFEEEFVYSIKSCRVPLKTYGINLKPLYLNVLYEIAGAFISFGRKDDFEGISWQVKDKLTKDVNEVAYGRGVKYGQKLGYEQGKALILNSKPYRVGNLLLKPLKSLRKNKSLYCA